MKRRHHIVHRADKATAGGGLQQITEGEVVGWLAATMIFTLSIATENFMQRHSQGQFLKELEEVSMVWEKRQARRSEASSSKPKEST